MAENTSTTEKLTGFVNAWSDALTALTPFRPSTADAKALLDSSFIAAEKVLAGQRDLARTVLDAGVSLVDRVTPDR
ncbi:hypothetical protein GCM10009836_11520 [Pseudonocardia ailaonensis]|uniref:Uncharacterized protein n=1 Tax=Pseudonocardia ailaonensis TaxID=367279 RepID=A0ABN2MRH5_9PSEU